MFVAITWAAVTFALFGVLTWVLDRDPVTAATAPYAGLVGLLLAGLVVWYSVARTGVSPGPWWTALGATAGVYLSLVVVASFWGLRAMAEQVTSPFVLAAAVLGGLTVVLSWVGIRRFPG